MKNSIQNILAVVATQNYVLEQYYKQDLQLEKGFYNDVRK